jgi:sRNA-binding carbon storage regulator CsrA
MLVLSRKKSETLLINGVIRIEVMHLTKATVRLRVSMPKGPQHSLSIARKEPRQRNGGLGKAAQAGMNVVHMTLLNQQVVDLDPAISLGVVDADKARVLLVVDAPAGTGISTLEPHDPTRNDGAEKQNLLQFMGQGTERGGDDRDKPSVRSETRAEAIEGNETVADLLPFPATFSPER